MKSLILSSRSRFETMKSRSARWSTKKAKDRRSTGISFIVKHTHMQIIRSKLVLRRDKKEVKAHNLRYSLQIIVIVIENVTEMIREIQSRLQMVIKDSV